MSPDSDDAKNTDSTAAVKQAALAVLPKVQLDIDDAPFLYEAEPQEPQEPQATPDTDSTAPEDAPIDETAAPSKKKKKLIIIAAAAGLVLLLVGGGALWWFVLRTPPPLPQPVEPTIVVVPGTQEKAPPSEFYITLAPFWLELTNEDQPERTAKDDIYFLVCKFTALTFSEAVLQEAQGKQLVLRDALYFYLKNKSYSFLTKAENSKTIKNDLVSVLNGYLITGKVEDMLFERFVSK